MWNCANYIHVLYQYQCKGNEHHWFIENKSLAIHVFIKQIYETWSDWIIMKICFSYYLAFLHKAYNTGPWRFNILQSDHIFLNAKSLQNHHLPDWTSFSVNACVLKVFYIGRYFGVCPWEAPPFGGCYSTSISYLGRRWIHPTEILISDAVQFSSRI